MKSVKKPNIEHVIDIKTKKKKPNRLPGSKKKNSVPSLYNNNLSYVQVMCGLAYSVNYLLFRNNRNFIASLTYN